ncbi:DUF805 domain-containing protein [Xylophilus sp. GW821-FHT01B05]
MNFGQAISVCLQKKYVDFSGRASRSEFWWFFLFQLLALLVASLIHQFVYFVVALGLFLPAISVSVRRLHDVGRSGWWLLLHFVPLIGSLVLLYWAVQPSQPGANEFGEPPAQLDLAGLPPGAV